MKFRLPGHERCVLHPFFFSDLLDLLTDLLQGDHLTLPPFVILDPRLDDDDEIDEITEDIASDLQNKDNAINHSRNDKSIRDGARSTTVAALPSQDPRDYVPVPKITMVEPELRNGSVFTAEVYRVLNPCKYCMQLTAVKGTGKNKDFAVSYTYNKCYVSARNLARCINCLDKKRGCWVSSADISDIPISREQRAELRLPEVSADSVPGRTLSSSAPKVTAQPSPAPITPTNTSTFLRSSTVKEPDRLHDQQKSATDHHPLPAHVYSSQSTRARLFDDGICLPSFDLQHSIARPHSPLGLNKGKRLLAAAESSEAAADREGTSKKARKVSFSGAPRAVDPEVGKLSNEAEESFASGWEYLKPEEYRAMVISRLEKANDRLASHISGLFEQLREQQRIVDNFRFSE